MNSYDDEDDFDDDLDDEREPEEFRCLFGNKCCMPGPHFEDECHTAEMIDAEREEWER